MRERPPACDDGSTMIARPAAEAPAPAPPYRPRRAARDTHAPVAGGVASGLARHLAVPVIWVRVAFVLATLVQGLGIMLYAGLWIFLPAEPQLETGAPGLDSAARTGRRPRPISRITDAGPAVALGALMLGVVLGVDAVFGQGVLFWPLAVAVAGTALLWRQADEAQRERWLDSTGRIDPFRAVFGRGGWGAYARVAAGLGLVVTALVLFALSAGQVRLAGELVAAVLLGVAGLAIVVGPWAVRLVSDLGAERAARVRSQERADLAAHLHDSVLQTLALIQKNSHDAGAVARLARSQERDLRTWLFETGPPDATTLAGALRELASQVEQVHPVIVDVVTVGDCPRSEPLRALTDATREAIVNAAKHAGVGRVDVYAEVTPEAVEVFVRDRGVGYDAASVSRDRHGVRHSILDRMVRHGGRAQIRTAPGEGTEVWLHLPLEQRPTPNPEATDG